MSLFIDKFIKQSKNETAAALIRTENSVSRNVFSFRNTLSQVHLRKKMCRFYSVKSQCSASMFQKFGASTDHHAHCETLSIDSYFSIGKNGP